MIINFIANDNNNFFIRGIHMINIVNTSREPYFNLALEEYFVKHKSLGDDLLILWQNEPTIVVGKNQNTYEEINTEYVKENNINVVRRLSGGGAVYHDLGNLNFTIIKNESSFHQNDFSFFALPVIGCLKKLGIAATFDGRNDILIDGKKFSGNAQYFHKDIVLHHGTLLFSSDLTILSKALNVKKEKFESKGVKSVSSRVTNISAYLDETVTLEDFRRHLTISMFGEDENAIQNYTLTQEDLAAIMKLRDSKYKTFEWIYGNSPKMSYKKDTRFAAGTISLAMEIKDGVIQDFVLYGDFFEGKPSEELKQFFIGKRYDKVELESVLCNIKISEYIHLLDNEEFEQLLF
jgi:lipoate---protein ligase